MMIHAPDCDPEAPWCDPRKCRDVIRTATLTECERALGRSRETIRKQCDPVAYDARGRALYDLTKVKAWFADVPVRQRRKAS